MRCHSCKKGFRRKNVIKCLSCSNYFHIRCFKSVNSEKVCFDCLPENIGCDAFIQHLNRICPELENLTKIKGLKVLHMNIRGLVTNFTKFYEIFESFRNIDIFGVTETHLQKDVVHNIKIPGYVYINKPWVKGIGGGVGVYILEEIAIVLLYPGNEDGSRYRRIKIRSYNFTYFAVKEA